MAENFPTNNTEHHDHHEALLLRAERLKDDIRHLRINASDALREVSEDARALTGMASITFGLPTINPVTVTNDDEDDDELDSEAA